MNAENRGVVEFLRRLADLIDGDEAAAEVLIGDDARLSVRMDGKVEYSGTGSEAILIARGPIAGRADALRRVIAQVPTS